METKSAPFTCRFAVPDAVPDLAVISVLPDPTPMASPLEPTALEMVAVKVSEEVQMAELVMFCVLASEKVPVAVNC